MPSLRAASYRIKPFTSNRILSYSVHQRSPITRCLRPEPPALSLSTRMSAEHVPASPFQPGPSISLNSHHHDHSTSNSDLFLDLSTLNESIDTNRNDLNNYGLAAPTSSIEDQSTSSTPIPSSTPTPLPLMQIAILLFLLLTEPIAGFVIYPFIAKLVGELGITTNNDKNAVGYYVGLIESLFYVAQGLTVFHWGRLSDSLGRRPVILLGTLGLSLSLLAFGFTTTVKSSNTKESSPWASFAWVVFARSLAGFLDGNSGVEKTMIGELSDESNRARAVSFFPTIWILGATIAPLVGGALEHPAEKFPGVFGSHRVLLWTTYPYLLPCLVAASFCFIAFLIGWVFLKETLPPSRTIERDEDHEALPHTSSIDEDDASTPLLNGSRKIKEPSMRELLTRPIIISILNYGSLALLDIAYFSIMTVFFAVPISSGGLGFPPSRIGIIFSAFGIVSGCVQIFLFPLVHDKFGAKRVLRLSVMSFLLVFPIFVVMNSAAAARKTTANIDEGHTNAGVADGIWVWVGVIVLVCLNPLIDMGYGCSFIFVTSSAPTPSHLGSINGLAQTIISFTRAIGPAGSTALFSLSNEKQWLGGYGIYAVMMGFTLVALRFIELLPDDEVLPAE
ncbi:MFS general substrate transporter [Clavulina sp. PMI_390]|nr:MFS general substrate transporter [Clavulina sp. PMI_390]